PAQAPARTLVAQPQPQPPQPATDVVQTEGQPAELAPLVLEAPEPLPELVVDKTALKAAQAELDLALEHARLAVTALDAASQSRYIQEAINRLAGFNDPAFRATNGSTSAETYRGVRPLLIEARVVREAAEVQWIAAAQAQVEARARRMAQVAQAGGDVQVPAPAAPVTIDLAQTVGPHGVLGTRGVRVEEQATDLVSRAIRQASEALRTIPQAPAAGGGAAESGPSASYSDQATSQMEWVVKMLESAKKIVAIALER
ncbi:MAG: hypothetical protein QN137_09215, partial [Armatimonadota bacterium]|nr:hypothetical protein [Armatimonadota bacterium]